MRNYALQRTSDPKMDAILGQIEQMLQAGFAHPLRDAVSLVEDVALTTSDSRVAHGLGQIPRGWIEVKRSSGAIVFTVTASDDPAKYVYLRSTAAITVSLLFF